MLNENQIYNRMNRFYQNELIEEDSDELFFLTNGMQIQMMN